MAIEPLQFSAIIVTYNEGIYLQSCLQSLSFCNQIVVLDLGSTDNTLEIAHRYATEVLTHEKIPIVEKIYPIYRQISKNDWIFVLDPDEVFEPALLPKIIELIARQHNIGEICIPRKNYFRHKPLHGTIWGGIQSVTRLIHKDRVDFPQVVHHGFVLKDGMVRQIIAEPGLYINHYWVEGYTEFIKKHFRYLLHEGEAKYGMGIRFNFLRMLIDTWRALINNLIRSGSWRHGLDEIVLSFLYTFYVFISWVALWKFERSKNIVDVA